MTFCSPAYPQPLTEPRSYSTTIKTPSAAVCDKGARGSSSCPPRGPRMFTLSCLKTGDSGMSSLLSPPLPPHQHMEAFGADIIIGSPSLAYFPPDCYFFSRRNDDSSLNVIYYAIVLLEESKEKKQREEINKWGKHCNRATGREKNKREKRRRRPAGRICSRHISISGIPRSGAG